MNSANMFTKKDLELFKKKNIEVSEIKNQISCFKKGFPFAYLKNPAIIDNGITKFTETNVLQLEDEYTKLSSSLKIVKFIPASGAASRMFKSLFNFNNEYSKNKDIIRTDNQDIKSSLFFFDNITKFAFYNDLKEIMKNANIDIDVCKKNKDFCVILDFLLTDKGLNYSNLPKALLKFHSYKDKTKRAFEEHLVEGANYAKSYDNKVYQHFSLSDNHMEKFNNELKLIINDYENTYKVKYIIDYSLQKSHTDTIAADLNNEPFHENGEILFRPGGHGALIENLNDIDADIVFIKNIDNIVSDHLKEETIVYKKVIGSHLINLRNKLFHYLELLDKKEINDEIIKEIINFSKNDLFISFEDDFNELSSNTKISFLFNRLNRPLRVCGMVKNEGEPGGGPFWVKNDDGISLQIVESSQIDKENKEQKAIFESSTHFNPVDLVCSIKDFNGNTFNLIDFIDSKTGFISIKSQNGKKLKALELPGLWNGSMAKWISIFVEVPLITFNPVKTVNDLLRDEHL